MVQLRANEIGETKMTFQKRAVEVNLPSVNSILGQSGKSLVYKQLLTTRLVSDMRLPQVIIHG